MLVAMWTMASRTNDKYLAIRSLMLVVSSKISSIHRMNVPGMGTVTITVGSFNLIAIPLMS